MLDNNRLRRYIKDFDFERVTKRFCDRFKTEHSKFLDFIEGIPDEDLQCWYASVMLNRLMFIYFIQKKGFIDNDTNYLSTKLTQSKQLSKAYSSVARRNVNRFYTDFICPLFFEGFTRKEEKRSPGTRKLLGKVPYLNGGIFLKHQIEELYGEQISIPDSAFERLFSFFGQYNWHLDKRPLRRDDEINPDVLGYIFEKYINQKQMGAYYTKDDITEYISKNTIIPSLFDTAQKKCRIAFTPPKDNSSDTSVWRLLQSDPDRYIYDAVKKGVELPLPENIAVGLNYAPKRTEWNKSALRGVSPRDPKTEEEYALPTEIWREVVARRKRYEEVHAKLVNGEIRDINDLITYNLNIRQFAQDVIENCEGPELLRAFWQAITQITVLDPTCGSGAFLFAALNILNSLYEACIDRMESFVSELDRSTEKHHPEKYSDFRKVIEQMDQHPNRRYFILKSIILNNIYGVDIMDEAVEICKLRLFLKLVAQLESVDRIEPLPDIDFNIRAGNTLVGFAAYNDIKDALKSDLLAGKTLQQIEENARCVDGLFEQFRKQQTEYGDEVTHTDKQKLLEHLEVLEKELNGYLAEQYGIDINKESDYSKWLSSHKPFHWLIEFHSIMKNGGFDVIIGNPPYININKVQKGYKVKGYITEACSDIYALVLERVYQLLIVSGRSGMILPLSLGFSQDFDSCRKLLFKEYGLNWFSSYGRIPSALFNFDVRVRNTIHIGYKKSSINTQYATRLHRWFEAFRPHLFEILEYTQFSPELWQNRIPKLNNHNISKAFENCMRQTNLTIEAILFPRQTPYQLHFKKTAYNWLIFCEILPPCYDKQGDIIEHTQFGTLYFSDSLLRDVAFLFLNGKIAYIFWLIVGDDFHLAKWMFANFPINFSRLPKEKLDKLISLVDELKQAMNSATSFKLNAGRNVGNYNLAKCRHVTDRSDRIFANYLGIDDIWEDVEFLYSQVVKTDFNY